MSSSTSLLQEAKERHQWGVGGGGVAIAAAVRKRRERGRKKKSFVFWQVGSDRGRSAVIAPPTATDALGLIQESNWVGDMETDCSGAV